jgi:SAP domain-containing ribonucleoprotein
MQFSGLAEVSALGVAAPQRAWSRHYLHHSSRSAFVNSCSCEFLSFALIGHQSLRFNIEQSRTERRHVPISRASPIRVAPKTTELSSSHHLAKMPEYAKMKNAELEALLKERSLPATGKKADMVDRLTKDDEKKSAPATNTNAEDEIDWDDDGDEAAAPAAKTEASVTTNEETIEKAGGEGQPPNPQAVPNQVADIDPAQTDDLTVQPPAEGGEEAKPEEPKEPAPDFTKGLAATNLDEEIERRRKRAEKFGLKVEDDEGLKKLERAKKFGESAAPRGLDEALPERGPRKRGREGGDEAGDNKRRGGGRSGGRGGRGGGRDGGRDRRDNRDTRDSRDNRDNRNRGDREPRKEQGRSNGSGTWMNDKDKAAADARKAKWANSAAS